MMARARQRLKGHWLEAALATLIYTVILSAASATYVGELILAGPLLFGYVLYLMCLNDTGRSDFNMLFTGFNRFAETLVAGLLTTLAISIGIALLIVPGVILSLGFSMVFFIMAEDKNISGIDAIKASWEMMKGNKGELFMLWLRFIGWALLACLTCGIGFLWLYPYMYEATYNFYRQLRYGTF